MFTILVVEDDASLNKMICAKLNREQFRAVPAFDGEEALEVMDREHIDLIISDIMMPKLDGYELTKLLDEIWGIDSDTDERNVDAHIKKLRKKFENQSDFEIITVRGLGYKAVFKNG